MEGKTGAMMFHHIKVGLVLVFLLTLFATVVTAYGQTNRGFLIAVPNVIVRKSTARLCTTFHDILGDVTITYKLRCTRRQTSYTQIESYPNGMDKCIDLHVPSYINRAKAYLTASISLAGAPPSAKPPVFQKTVTVAPRNYMIIIQTDKPLYKPGQTVRIRILSVTLDLRPREENITMVFLEDPDGYRLTEWRNVRSRVGLAELEYPLAEDTTIGNWKLIVETEKDYRERKLFTVTYYVLPDFEATVEAPKFLPADGSSFVVRVCAKYIYGKAVVGNYTLVTCTSPTSCQRKYGQLKGCMNSLIKWDPDITKPNELSSITVYANVTDIHTGLTMQSGKQLVHSNGGRVTVDLKKFSAPYFKPGIPYSGKVVLKFLSGEPAEGAKLALTVWHDGDPPDGQKKLRYRVTYSADAKGEVLFTLPKLSKKVNSFKLRAQGSTRYTKRMLLKSTEAVEFTVHAWYSPSNSYVQMESQHHLGTCINSLTINTTVIMPPRDGGNIRFHYQVLANRGVLDTGSIDHIIHTQAAYAVSPPGHRHIEHIDVGDEIVSRKYTDRWMNVSVIPNPYKTISQHGHIVRWSFYSNPRVHGSSHEPIYLQVWRKDSAVGSTYILVGQTRIAYNDRGKYVKALEGHERIRVAEGDTLGIYFPRTNPIPFSYRRCSDSRGGDKTLYDMHYNIHGEVARFQPIISKSWIPCREYSLNAVLEADESLGSDYDIEVIPHHFMLDVRASRPLPPKSHLLLYYVTDGGEVVSDVIRLDTSPCYSHNVSLAVRPTSGSGDPYPGDNVTMEIKAEPGSFCAIGVVDRSVHAMEEPSYLDIDKLYNRIAKRLPEINPPTDDCVILQDAKRAFEIAGLSVMTDLNVNPRPCSRPYATASYCPDCDPSPVETIDKEYSILTPSTTPWIEPPSDTLPNLRSLYPGLPTLKHRFYFPETWLWDTVLLEPGQTSSSSVHTLPHTITEWAGNAFCLHATSGLGVAPTTVVKAFQPFFISFTLPATVIRDEVIPLQVTINSYLDECFELALRLDLSDSLALEEGGIEEVICMCEQNTVGLPYKIAPLDVGQINVTFSAEAVEGRDVCEWTDGKVVAMDTLTKPLTVLPEGIEEEKTQTTIACVNGFEDEQLIYMNFTIPEHVVDDSQEAYITVTADVMGPTVEKVHKLLKHPTGCGEQNLAKLATNIHVMSYLVGTGQMTEKREKRGKQYIAEGYQKVLKFRRRDGSYSPFGRRDPQGSLWLTAFAIRTFAHARAHTFVEEDAFQGSIYLLQSHQQDSGCFLPTGMVHNKLILGGLNQTHSSPAGLSAYIMAALLDAGLSRFSPVLMRLVKCLDRQMPSDLYSLSMMAYAYSVYEPGNHKREECLERLFERATRRGGLLYWKVAPTPETPEGLADPVDIEVTAYVLLALLASGTQDDLESGAPIVRWLTSQRNAEGGFASTQDTVVAVESLAKYAARTYKHETNIVVTIDGSEIDGNGQLTITSKNRLLAQRRRINVLPADMRFVITGTGCALIQGVSRYNVPVVVKPQTYFSLDVAVQSVPHPSASSTRSDCPRHLCWVRRLEICARYTGPGGDSNMAVVDIKMVTGWHPEENELARLKGDPNSTVAETSYKLETSTVHLYFNTLTRHHDCISMNVRQHDEVGNVQAAHVRVYDYYRTTDVGRVQTYQIEEICTEEEKDFCLVDATIQ